MKEYLKGEGEYKGLHTPNSSTMMPSAAVVEREKAKTKTTLNVMAGSMKAEYAEEIVGDTVRGFVDPRGSFDTSDR